ncbi:hypothetical protein [Actinoplanes sp. N902-109]|uniref:hypothetical protein n=1 Tax=Actinoplanes sp. (strain N902-109) TaxID=649831 RepID=UPI0006855415|nr:hypothetical protein [Actinoplanes sp. N902-109]
MAERLGAVDWQRRGYRSWSQSKLMLEFFRRAAQWAEAYRCDTHTPFYDIAACVDPAVRADKSTVDEVVRGVEDGGWDVEQVTPFIVHWAALRPALGPELPPGLDDPFEPLVLLFERGGGFSTANGWAELEYVAVPLRDWRTRAERPPMASFAAAELDEIDRAGSLEQFGYVMGPDGQPLG